MTKLFSIIAVAIIVTSVVSCKTSADEKAKTEERAKFAADSISSVLSARLNQAMNSVTATTEVNNSNSKKNSTVETVQIGSQTWSAKNLNVSAFRNGDIILEAKTNEDWEKAAKLHIPAWCYYDNNSENGTIYGKLYNWFAVMDERTLAPEGFHVPKNEEYWLLLNTLGCNQYSSEIEKHYTANKLRSTNNLWKDNQYSTNESSFSALPSGVRYDWGGFSGIKEKCYLRSISDNGDLGYTPSDLGVDDWVSGPGASTFGAGYGLAVRCIVGESNILLHTIPVLSNDLIEFDENGKPKQGEWMTNSPSGFRTATKHFKDGVEEGERINYGRFAYKEMVSKGNYKNGLPSGQWDFFGPGEYIIEQGDFVNGKKEGEWIKYSSDGGIYQKLVYSDDKLIKKISYDENGNVK
jgi:uncharacterized protein (TIGR02145 family)